VAFRGTSGKKRMLAKERADFVQKGERPTEKKVVLR